MTTFKTYASILSICFSLLLTSQVVAQAENKTSKSETIFPKGEKLDSDNFTGTAWVSFLIPPDSLNQTYVGNVTFEPGARTNWHSHPAGQIILVTDGVGYYQEKGSPKKILRKGDSVKCPPNLAHWHGASPDNEFVQLAISSSEHGSTKWLEPVTDEEYNSSVED